MKKKIVRFCLTFFFLTFTSFAFAQMTADPGHNFYKDAQRWQSFGIVENLPPLRPYPYNVIKNILLEVIECDLQNEASRAEEYYEELTGKAFNASFEAGASTNLYTENPVSAADTSGTADGESKTAAYFSGLLCPRLFGDLELFDDLVGIGYKVGFAGFNCSAKDYLENFLPAFSFLSTDTLQDSAEVLVFKFYLDTNETLSVGKNNIFVQLGVNRIGYGSFLDDGLSLNDNAYHMPNIAFTVMQPRWSYSQLYAALGATRNYDGNGLMANKYLAFHQLTFKLTNRMSLSYYENIIFGNRFDFSYIIPAAYMAIQGIGGCDDNLQVGLRFDYRILDGLLWASDIFVDDVNFNELIKFNFDTKIRVAFTSGLIFNPKNSAFSNITLKYTLVTPYTYSHWQYKDDAEKTITANTYNYQSYTNNGYSIGSSLMPNSDQVKASFDFSPVKNLDLTFNFAFARHGNSSETLTTDEALIYMLADSLVYATDGSINQHVEVDGGKYLDSAWDHLNFLNQEHKMYIFQAGLAAKYTLAKFNWGSISLRASYDAEYTVNKGVDSNLFPGGLTVQNEDGTYSYDGQVYSSAESLLAAYKSDWVADFRNVFTNYFYFGLEYRW